jgi:hypothetical protein
MVVFVKRMERNGLFMGPISFLKVLLKINLNILIFYIKLITFYHFSNKKITTKHSYFFTFLYKTFFFPYQSNLLQYRSISKSHSIHKHNLYIYILIEEKSYEDK